jgi:tight adherence protein C
MSLLLPSSIPSTDIASGLAALAAFAAVVTLAMPPSGDNRLKSRLRSVARERHRLREQRLAELSTREAKSRLRLKPRGMAARLVSLWREPSAEEGSDIASQLRMAGLRGPVPEAAFQFGRAAFPVLFFAAALLFGMTQDIGGSRMLALAVAGAALGYGLPRLILGRLIARRQRAILSAFPDSLDLLLICIHAGMSVEAALARVTSEISSQSIPLAEELSLTMAELSYLPSRWRAYHNLGERTGLAPVKLIAAALAQAERYGTPISQALGAVARECREARLFEAERKAAALPPKLTVPLVVFFLPVLMGVILAPAAMQAGKSWRDRPAIIARPFPAAAPNSQAEPSSPARPQAGSR